MSISLGWNPVGLTINVSPGMRFKPPGIQLQTPLGVAMNWPATTSARIVLTNTPTSFATTWTASVVADIMSWDIAANLVDLVPDGSHAQLFLTYGTAAEILWQSGGVVRKS